MANRKIEKFLSLFSYVNKEISIQAMDEKSRGSFMELVLNQDATLNEAAYEFFALEKSNCISISTTFPAMAIYQTMMLEEGFKNPSSEVEVQRFRALLDYCNETYCTANDDPIMSLVEETELDEYYDKVLTYFINTYMKNNKN